MTISEVIENITDRALFEKIAVDVLRENQPDFWNIIHSGINSRGETIASPLDAFHSFFRDLNSKVLVVIDDVIPHAARFCA